MFRRYVPRSARVLDAGAGTGLVGESLKRLGYSNIEALDLSLGMLEEARKKNAYSAFHQMILGETLDFPDRRVRRHHLRRRPHPRPRPRQFAARNGPRNPARRPRGVHPAPGRVREQRASGEVQDELATSGKWTLEEATEPLASLPKGEPDVLFQVWIYRVGSA